MFFGVNELSSGTDLNSLTNYGTYKCSASSTAATFSHCPYNAPFVLWVFANNNAPYRVQLFFSQLGSWIRYSTTGDWKEFSTDIPSFYKDYSTLAGLANAMSSELSVKGLVSAPSGLDADSNDFQNGLTVYFIASGTTTVNMPNTQSISSAYFVVLKQAGGYKFEMYMNIVDCKLYIRTTNNSGQAWGWKQVSAT